MTKKTDCPFCLLEAQDKVILENSTFIVKFDRYPVSEGHLLVIPKRHVHSFPELRKIEVLGFFEILKDAQTFLGSKYSPAGFNIGINQGKAAGQTIEHLHIHIIPRYSGDVKNPAGGVRKIIPNKVIYPIPSLQE
jgi:diadenosine tetraphosphate (Ap4A) HIT family hydrolase